jgi:predicted nucleotidyltransferase
LTEVGQVGSHPIRDLPEEVSRVLGEFVEAAREAFGEDLVSVLLYGSGAEGALRKTSDVNVILVLSAFDRAKADRLRDALRMAQAAIRLSAMFLLREEVPSALESFSQKFADVLRRRRLLYGTDPFVGLRVSREALIKRLNQVLLNLTLRLRAFYVERSLDEEQLVGVVAEVAGPIRASAASLLELEGMAPGSPKEALRRFTSSLDGPGWDQVLAHLSQARETRLLPPGAAGEALMRLLDLTQKMRARAHLLS